MKEDIKIDNEKSLSISIDLIGIGTEFTIYVPFLKEDINYIIVDNKKYSRINKSCIIDNDKFVCEMVDYGGPHVTFTRDQILAVA